MITKTQIKHNISELDRTMDVAYKGLRAALDELNLESVVLLTGGLISAVASKDLLEGILKDME